MAYSTINKSTDNFNTVLYTGNGSLPRAITGVGHQPDFVWLKDRDTAYNHQLYDIVRGTSAGVLYSNSTSAEDSAYQLSSFNSDGFTLGSNLGAVNENNKKIVSWNWKANGAGSANTDGSINSTVSVNTTAGFSIVKYTGTGSSATVGHGLGVAPKLIILKTYSATKNWIVGHDSLGWGKNLYLHATDGENSSSTIWANTSPTNSVFSVSTNNDTNQSGVNIIAYCFAEKTGYNKFGKYTGNGNANGTFVYTGFKPAFVMVKRTNSSGDWQLVDNKRLGYNVDNNAIFPNLSNTEDTGDVVDILSNGFKVRSSTGTWNASSGTYIYMAFGQSIVGSNNIPATAR